LVDKCGIHKCPDDARITANVQSRLDSHSDLGSPNSIGVQTVNHVVYLNGIVSTRLESDIAESVANKTPGVTNVVNSIGIEK
jgi:osmotically-inducible protein OsmY